MLTVRTVVILLVALPSPLPVTGSRLADPNPQHAKDYPQHAPRSNSTATPHRTNKQHPNITIPVTRHQTPDTRHQTAAYTSWNHNHKHATDFHR
jgi:hypothetical protein